MDIYKELLARFRMVRELTKKEYSKLVKAEKERGKDLSNDEIAEMFGFKKNCSGDE